MRKGNAIIFVDYEDWYHSSIIFFGLVPDVVEWHLLLKEKYECEIIYFFANFTRYPDEVLRLGEVEGNAIINTDANDTEKRSHHVMQEYIYQTSQGLSPDTFVLFSGREFFKKVIQYVITEKRKEVIVYAIRGSLGKSLKEEASQSIEWPYVYSKKEHYIRAVVNIIDYIERKDREQRLTLYSLIVAEVSEKFEVQQEVIEDVISEMLSLRYLYQVEVAQVHGKDGLLMINKRRLRERGFLI
jgi:hypothetical protein